MESTDQRPFSILGTALALAVFGDILLRGCPWGVNFPIFTAGSFVGLGLLSRRCNTPLIDGSVWFMMLAVACAAFLAIRDSGLLAFFDVAGTAVAVSITTLRSSSFRLRTSFLVEYIHGLFATVLHALTGGLLILFKDLPGGAFSPSPARSRLVAILRGTALTIPPLLFFGALLISADASFEYLVVDLLNINLTAVVDHLFLISLLAFLLAGVLRARFFSNEMPFPTSPRPSFFSLGITEVAILVGGLDLLFAAFVAVQLPYFFGGTSTLLATPQLTCAEYFRRGFFELVTVAALALPVLLGADWILRKESPRHLLLFRILGGINIVLLFIIMASAALRFLIYQGAFGLTESRLYAASVVVWLGMVFFWFGLTVLAGRRERFAFGALAAGYLVLIGLNVLNPDAFIASTNIARGGEGKPFDVQYNGGLSADAVPVLIQKMATLQESDRRELALRIVQSPHSVRRGDWRSWNTGRSAARDALDRHRAFLESGGAIHNPAGE